MGYTHARRASIRVGVEWSRVFGEDEGKSFWSDNFGFGHLNDHFELSNGASSRARVRYEVWVWVRVVLDKVWVNNFW